MRYLLLKWLHSEVSEPVEFYFELDEIGWEGRRIHKYIDGRFEKFIGIAEGDIGSVEEWNADPDCEGSEIDAATFDALWDSLSGVECQDFRRARGLG